MLLCVTTAISAIPTVLPTFVQAMLSSGARQFAAAKAVVKSLNDVETLGGTTAINTDKTGTLTMNAMTATTMLAGGRWFQVQGRGYETGAILVTVDEPARLQPVGAGPDALHGRDRLGLSRDVIGDPAEAAFVVLATRWASTPRRPGSDCRAAPGALRPPTKFMATFRPPCH